MVSKFRRKYTPEFRDTAVREVTDKSRPITDVARELGLIEQTLRNWVAVHLERHGGVPQLRHQSDSLPARGQVCRRSSLTTGMTRFVFCW